MKRFLLVLGGLVVLYRLRLLFSGYANTGPFTDNAAPPLAATFFNNVENFLDTVNSLATDTHVSSDGSGNATVHSVVLQHGSLSRVSKFTGTTSITPTNFNHGLGTTPDIILINIIGASNSPHSITYDNLTSSQVRMTGDGNNPFYALAIAF